jgi:hypothetical protein
LLTAKEILGKIVQEGEKGRKRMYISIGKAARMMGVSTSTLRIWDRKKLFKVNYRTAGGHRRYNVSHQLRFLQL